MSRVLVLVEGVPPRLTSQDLPPLLEPGRSPEEINDGETTHPSARLARRFPAYQKTLHGRLVTGRVGLNRLRHACPHFDGWVRQLEELAP